MWFVCCLNSCGFVVEKADRMAMTTRDLLHAGYGAGIMQNPYYGAAADRSLPYYGKYSFLLYNSIKNR